MVTQTELIMGKTQEKGLGKKLVAVLVTVGAILGSSVYSINNATASTITEKGIEAKTKQECENSYVPKNIALRNTLYRDTSNDARVYGGLK